MPSSFERRTVSLIVRLWAEGSHEGDQPLWRGQIEHVGTGERVYFLNVIDLLAAIGDVAPGFLSQDNNGSPRRR